MTHSSMSFIRGFGSTEPDDVQSLDQTEQDDPGGAQRPVTRSTVGWRYGSALAAARALNARPVRL